MDPTTQNAATIKRRPTGRINNQLSNNQLRPTKDEEDFEAKPAARPKQQSQPPSNKEKPPSNKLTTNAAATGSSQSSSSSVGPVNQQAGDKSPMKQCNLLHFLSKQRPQPSDSHDRIATRPPSVTEDSSSPAKRKKTPPKKRLSDTPNNGGLPDFTNELSERAQERGRQIAEAVRNEDSAAL